jgi:hypothetical protein
MGETHKSFNPLFLKGFKIFSTNSCDYWVIQKNKYLCKKYYVMETIVINTVEPSKLEQIKTFLNSLNVSFEIKKTKKTKEYDPEFVKKILATKNEKSIRVNPKNIWESIL